MRYSILILFWIFCLGIQMPAYAQKNGKQKVLRVGVYDNYPKVFIDKHGKPDGIFIDMIKHIAKKEKWKLEFVISDWNNLYKMLLDEKIDVVPDFAFSDKRDSLFTLNNLSLMGSWLEVFTTEGNQINSVLDLKNQKIGVLKGSIQEEYLNKNIEESFNINLQVIAYESYQQSVDALTYGEVFAIVTSRFFYFSDLCTDHIVPTGVIMRPSELYYAFPKNVDTNIVVTFDKYISEAKNKSGSVYYKSINRLLDKEIVTALPERIIRLIVILLIIALVLFIFVIVLRLKVKQKTAQLILAKDKAEESDRLKTVFLQNMSHEIRTPMNGIIGFLSLIKDKEINSDVRNEYIDIVNTSGKRLLNTINDIMEISKIEANQISVNKTQVDIYDLMQFQYSFFYNQASKKGLELVMPSNIPKDMVFETDKQMIESIISNLINNAIKYTKNGTIEFGCSINESNILFYVKDTGIGIPEERQTAIFDRFVHANLALSRSSEGAGLGLSIVKAYADMLNGQIWLESEINKGTIFYFTHPYTPVAKNILHEMPEESGAVSFNKKIKILVAEDDEISYLFLENILNDKNISLIHVSNGFDAVKAVKELSDISVVLMDIKMPELDGLEATKEIRKFNKNIPIIAQTAFAMSGDRENAILQGCNDYISKPINKKELINIIIKYTN